MIWLLVGCDADGAAGAGGAFAIAEYFAGAEAWTWREPTESSGESGGADTSGVDDTQVLRGELSEDGVVNVRRGARFADGVAVGSFTWDQAATDLVLDAWTWNDGGSSEPTILARNGGLPGDLVTNLQGNCVGESETDVETRYGTFDYALKCTCADTHAPAGSWWFAKGFGLVKAETESFNLDLVAPR